MPLYFPRSPSEEEFVAYHVPYDIGSEIDGEPIIAERQIRISGKPTVQQRRESRASRTALHNSIDSDKLKSCMTLYCILQTGIISGQLLLVS